MYENKGINYLRDKLNQKKKRVDLRYKFYDMKNISYEFEISTPPKLKNWSSCLNWCADAVDVLADRLVFREFRNDPFDMNGILMMNNPDVLVPSSILGALISSCDFIYLYPGDDGFPCMQVIDGGNATGVMNEVTGFLDEGYAVLDRDDDGKPVREAYFTIGRTEIIENDEVTAVEKYPFSYATLVPIVYRPDARRPFGRSRISRSNMSLVGSALRTIKRSEISAEFYSFPQKWITGLSEDVEGLEKWRASMSAMLAITNDEDGENNVKIGQFTQQSMQPHVDHLKSIACLFAGGNGMTLDDMGFTTENPASADAIKAAHDKLRLTARKAQANFGSGLMNACIVGCCMRDGVDYDRAVFYDTKKIWAPIFEPDASSISTFGDAVSKVNAAVPGFFTAQNIEDVSGIAPGEE